MSDDQSGIEQARAARRRAEADLAAMKAKRPEVKRLAWHAMRIRDENHLSDLVALAFGTREP
jgi:cob(I)alamin adenosyltransferase